MERICIAFGKKPLFSQSIVPDNTDRVWFAENINDLTYAIELACYMADKVSNVEVSIKIIDEDFKSIDYKSIINKIVKNNSLGHNIVFKN